MGISTGYLEAFIKYIQPELQKTSRGTGLQHINQKVFWDVDVPIAPHGEQGRSQINLEDLSVKIDDCQKRLAKIPVIIKRFRQSILNAACTGRLTADWRVQARRGETDEKLIKQEHYKIGVPDGELTDLPDAGNG
jgi:type I restriction enzyme S subunit